ncbi:MAG: DUF2157 domain-containing protein [Isosphaeraceae bacterium]
MAARDISDRQRAWLLGEIASWNAQGLIRSDQMAGILELYGTPEELAERRGARALFTLTSLAALLVCLAVLLLIGYNWQDMPAAVKLAIIFLVLLGTHACGFVLRYRLGRRTASEIVFFAASLFYGAAISLVAQIFHINAGDADGFWWWSLGVLPFALCLDTLLLHALVVFLLALYAGFSVFGSVLSGSGWLPLLGLPANGAYSVLPLSLLGLSWAYRKRSPGTVALYVPLIAWWVVLQPFAWRLEANPVYFIGCVGGFLLLVAEFHEEESRLAIPFRFYGSLLAAGSMIPLSYYSFQRAIEIREGTIGVLAELVLTGSLAVGLAAVVGDYQRRSSGAGASLARAVFGQGRRWVPLGIIAFMTFLGFWNVFLHEPLIPTLLANAALISLALWLMQVGLREDRGMPFSSGVLLFLLWAVLRYIDLFGDFGGMLGAALLFFLCGATLFGMAQYWRRRKVVHHV